jgi:hypothetical protein
MLGRASRSVVKILAVQLACKKIAQQTRAEQPKADNDVYVATLRSLRGGLALRKITYRRG